MTFKKSPDCCEKVPAAALDDDGCSVDSGDISALSVKVLLASWLLELEEAVLDEVVTVLI